MNIPRDPLPIEGDLSADGVRRLKAELLAAQQRLRDAGLTEPPKGGLRPHDWPERGQDKPWPRTRPTKPRAEAAGMLLAAITAKPSGSKVAMRWCEDTVDALSDYVLAIVEERMCAEAAADPEATDVLLRLLDVLNDEGDRDDKCDEWLAGFQAAIDVIRRYKP